MQAFTQAFTEAFTPEGIYDDIPMDQNISPSTEPLYHYIRDTQNVSPSTEPQYHYITNTGPSTSHYDTLPAPLQVSDSISKQKKGKLIPAQIPIPVSRVALQLAGTSRYVDMKQVTDSKIQEIVQRVSNKSYRVVSDDEFNSRDQEVATPRG